MSENGLDVPASLARVRDGDELAVRELMDHLQPLVAKIVRSHLPRRTAEEDLMQAVFIKIFSKMDQYTGAAPFEHWVSRVAVNTCLSQLSREKVRPEIRWADLSEDEEEVLQNLAATNSELPSESAFASREIVEKLLATLSPADRLVMTMLHMEGRSVEDVRKATGWSGALVKVRAFRVRHKLRKKLRLLMGEDPHEP